MNNLFKYVLVVILAIVASTGLLWADQYVEVSQDTVVTSSTVQRLDSLTTIVVNNSPMITVKSYMPVAEESASDESSEECNVPKGECGSSILWLIILVAFACILCGLILYRMSRKALPQDTKTCENTNWGKSLARGINQLITQDRLTVIGGVVTVLMLLTILIFIVILVVRGVAPDVWPCLNLNRFGLVGDFFGGFVGTFLTVIIAIYAIRTYKSERELQKEASISAMLSTMLELHRKNLQEIEITIKDGTTTLKGREAFRQMVEELREIFENVALAIKYVVESDRESYGAWSTLEKMNELAHELSYGYFFYRVESYTITTPSNKVLYDLCEAVRKRVLKTLPEYLHALERHTTVSHYYRHLYNMVNYIDKNKYTNNYKKKELFIKLIRSQLSDYEEILLYYNSLSSLGEAWRLPIGETEIENMNLICKYRLLKNCPYYLVYFGRKPSEEFKIERNVWESNGERFFETGPIE